MVHTLQTQAAGALSHDMAALSRKALNIRKCDLFASPPRGGFGGTRECPGERLYKIQLPNIFLERRGRHAPPPRIFVPQLDFRTIRRVSGKGSSPLRPQAPLRRYSARSETDFTSRVARLPSARWPPAPAAAPAPTAAAKEPADRRQAHGIEAKEPPAAGNDLWNVPTIGRDLRFLDDDDVVQRLWPEQWHRRKRRCITSRHIRVFPAAPRGPKGRRVRLR